MAKKTATATKKAETDNMAIWNAVEKTDPAMTKQVNQRGGFTAVCAQSQIMEATKLFGPMGLNWRVASEVVSNSPNLVLKVTLHYKNPNGEGDGVVHHYGSCRSPDKDPDSYKKALTDGTTKCLSLLGFNADVFLGKFDDNKYVQERKTETRKSAPVETKTASIGEQLTEVDSTKKPEGIDKVLAAQCKDLHGHLKNLNDDRAEKAQDWLKTMPWNDNTLAIYKEMLENAIISEGGQI